MTPTNLSDDARELVLVAAKIAYSKQGAEMLKASLENTKSKDAVIPAIALAATTVLHQMQERLDQLPDEEVWGKMGVVHSVLGTLFEVAKHLGYDMPESALKPAYEMVESMLESQKGQPDEQQPMQPQGDPQQAPPQQPLMMQGAMPEGMQ